MPNSRLTRLEFSLLSEDAELLQRYAKAHGTPASEIVRAALYDYVGPLKRAKEEREERTFREMQERRALDEWTGKTAGEKRATYDSVIRRLPNAGS